MPALTTIATAASIGSTIAGTGASFAQARQQRKLQDDAKRQAQKSLDLAKKRLEVNVYEQAAVAKEPYELQREALLRSGAQSLEAARESERGAAAAAGRLQMAQANAQGTVRGNMATEIQDMRNTIMTEDQRLLDEGQRIEEAVAEGAQTAAAEADENRRAAIMQGVQGLGTSANLLYQNAPLYMKDATARNLSRSVKGAGGLDDFKTKVLGNEELMSQFGLQKNLISAMSPLQLESYLQSNLTPDRAREFRSALFATQAPAQAPPQATPVPTGLQPQQYYDIQNPFQQYLPTVSYPG